MADMASKRQANFELLRIVAMFMIITLHYLVKGDPALYELNGRTSVYYAVKLLEAFCIVSVNCYVLLSGYFLIESEWKPGRILSLLLQVLFYSILIPVLMLCIGMISWSELSIYDWLGFLLPIETEHYWFATAYVMMYLFVPVLAAGVKKMTKKQLQTVIILLLLFFSLGKSIVPADLVTDNYGYHYGWFLCLFLIAAYLRLYGCKLLERKRAGLCLYVGMCLGIFLLSTAAGLLADRVDAFGYYEEMPYTYNHVLCLMGAVGLFSVFSKVRIWKHRTEALIRRLAPYTFGVYLLHEHILVRYEWMKWLQIDRVQGTWLFLPHMAACVLVVYLVGSLVDFARAYFFAAVGRLQWKR